MESSYDDCTLDNDPLMFWPLQKHQHMFCPHSLPNTKKNITNANYNKILTSKEFRKKVLKTLEISIPV